ncbi:NAD(P)/FAD-dependent oxidoreductase [Pseudonocardia sp. KRD291]|uniref:NAD(P)/FAD-dependent oxidoreductase n=1 Tax=Pseudonocardia sp. KRD291 TaxID=2792007 RepID=UPI001C4A2152|nr:FAD-dependent oxidoreductase [Pseudonocardia sp. KRD291]MBW0101239.1 FAD-dependent oxidoreductase [Pseudonocardia sp. KRD291]
MPDQTDGRETDAPVVVVGAGAAGLATVDALRAGGHAGGIVLVGEEAHAPYDRPPLSKQVLAGTWEPERVTLRSVDDLAAARVDCRLGVRAVGADPDARTVALSDGSVLAYRDLVVATGAGARRLPFGHDLEGVHVLRDLDDVLGMKAALDRRDGARVVVVGAGFLGAEVAAVARDLGSEVSLVDTLELPLRSVLGDEVGAMVADLHREHGVALHLGHGIVSFTAASGAVSAVVLDEGTELPADLVVVAIGAVPAVDWLRGTTIPIAGESPDDGAGGIRCDEVGRAGDHVYAVGDVAAWWSPRENRFVRLEHRLTATEHARTVSRELLGLSREAAAPVPYFWSDQYDLKLQAFGLPSGGDEFRVVEGTLADRRFVGVYGHAGRVSAVIGAGKAKAVRQWRQAVAEGRSWDEVGSTTA